MNLLPALAAWPILILATVARADTMVVSTVVDQHILPGFSRLAAFSGLLDEAAQAECTPDSQILRAAYNDAFDAWVAVSHLRFGPTETGERAFALAFWPDPRGSTPKTLGGLITAEDPAVSNPDEFAKVSVAGRGFYAMEYLLYDDTLSAAGTPEYHCALVRAVAHDIARTADGIYADWRDRYAALMKSAGAEGNQTYRSDSEALQELYKALSTGLQFTKDTRLGRPLGTFEKSWPTRAEAWRSARSLRHVILSLEATRTLAMLLSQDAEVGDPLNHAFAIAIDRAETLDDPDFSGVAEPQSRLRIEVLQQDIDEIRDRYVPDLGAFLGVAAGFNALDGD